MRRDERWRDLSAEHHHALVLARRATQAADAARDTRNVGTHGVGAHGVGTHSVGPEDLWAEVVRRFHEELEPHFEREERTLLPLVERAGGAALAERTRAEHEALRALVADTSLDVVTRLARFGELLREHVRFEERTLFAFAQAASPPDARE